MADPEHSTEVGRLPLVEEVAHVARHRLVSRVRVAVTTAAEDTAVQAILHRRDAVIERVPVGREVAAPPPIRQEGDTFVIPVLEERVEIVRRLVVTEEIRLRLQEAEETRHLPVRLRRQSVAVERTAAGPEAFHDIHQGGIAIMNQTLCAMFDSRAEAERAAEALRGLNVQASDIRVSGAEVAGQDDAWAGVSALGTGWLPEEDRAAYDEGMRRGGAVVTAEVAEGDMQLAMDAMEAAGAIDLDSREATWRSEGWIGAGAPDGTPGNPRGTMASRGVDKALGTNISGAHPENEAKRGKAGAARDIPGNPPGTMASRGVDQAFGTNISGAHPENETGRARAGTAGRDEVIPLVEEKLSVGKRVSHEGRVRVRAYTVERPVEEQVRLREEHVRVERHAADRPATGDEAAFRDRVIEAEESREEAVVRKEARVTGEVVVNKEATERTETVRDKVRRTEVDVDEDAVANDPRKRPGKGAA